MAGAIACWAIGELCWDAFIANAASAPIPSVSDIFWLTFYIPAYASVEGHGRVIVGQKGDAHADRVEVDSFEP